MSLSVSPSASLPIDTSTPHPAASVSEAISPGSFQKGTMEPRLTLMMLPGLSESGNFLATGKMAPDAISQPGIEEFSSTPSTSRIRLFEADGSSTALVLTEGMGSDPENATIVSVEGNATGSGKVITITVADESQPDGVSTVSIDTASLTQNANAVLGLTTHDPDSSQTKSLILVLPHQGSSNGESTYMLAPVTQTDTVDAASFANWGIGSLSGNGYLKNFGGTVEITVDGKTFLVWLDAGQAVGNGFSGNVSARFGILSADPTGQTNVVSGYIDNMTLKFTNGTLTGFSKNGETIENLDAFVRDKIANTTEFPAVTTQDQKNLRSNFNTEAVSFVKNYSDITQAILSSIAIADVVDKRGFFSRRNLDVQSPVKR